MTNSTTDAAIIEEIKSRVSITELISEDTPLDANGCGHHPKHTSTSGKSLTVTEDARFYYCFNCGEGGDCLNWLINNRGMTFPEAKKYLAQRAGIQLPETGRDDAHMMQIYNDRQELAPLMKATAQYYHDQLGQQHIDDMTTRWGLTRETIDRQLIGYAPSGGGLVRHLLAKGFDRGLIAKSGLVWQNDDGRLSDFFRARLVIPYWHNRQAVYFIGRWFPGCKDDPGRSKYKKMLTHSAKHPWVSPAVANDWFYGEDSANGAKDLLITEGVADCLMARQSGFACVSPVTVRFRKADYQKILRLAKRAGQVLICNDQEDSGAGENGALATAEFLKNNCVQVKLITLPRPRGVGKVDLAEYLRDHGGDALRALIPEARTCWEVKIDRLLVPSNHVEAVRMARDFATTELAGCDSLVALALIRGPLAAKIGLDDAEVAELTKPRQIDQKPRRDVNSEAGADAINSTDLGNARRLVARHGANLKYCWPWQRWLVWNGIKWRQDDTAEILRMAKDTVQSIYQEAAASEDRERREALADWARRSESEARINAMVSLARSEPGIPVSPIELDRDNLLFPVQNGVLDLRKNVFPPGHRQSDLITKIVPITAHPHAECPLWLSFLDRIMGRNVDMINFLQRCVGYSLTGDVSEHVLFILYGTGANGKSVFLNTLLALTGPYGKQAAPDLLLATKYDRHPTELAALLGVRALVSSETDEGRRLAEARIKSLTGGDPITARYMHGDFFTFPPTHKIWMATNHKPIVKGTDHGIWRRIRLIPFTVTIPDSEQDKYLQDKLMAELPGILNWAIKGYYLWQKNGLDAPDEVKVATEGYRTENDTMQTFLDDCCIVNKLAKSRSADLYGAYVKWCQASGERELSRRSFSLSLKDRGFELVHERSGSWFWGLGLQDGRQQAQNRPV